LFHPARAGSFKLRGPNGKLLKFNRHYRIREVLIDDLRSGYVIELLDAKLNKSGKQPFGRFFTGLLTRNSKDVTDGRYDIYLDDRRVGDFTIRTRPLSDRERIKCLDNLKNDGSLRSKLYGYRIQ